MSEEINFTDELNILDEKGARVNDETADRFREIVQLEYELAIRRATLIRDINLTRLNFGNPGPFHNDFLLQIFS